MAPSRTHRDLSPETAVDTLDQLYQRSVQAISKALQRFLDTGRPPTAAERRKYCYPFLRVTWSGNGGPPPPNRRAFAKMQTPGIYQTTVTHPDIFRPYLIEQLQPLVAEYGATLDVGISDQEIPYPYVWDIADDATSSHASAANLARLFPVPQLSSIGDEVADGQWITPPEGPLPLALFDAQRTDYSLRRLIHYTGSDWRNVQRWILLTNYHRYVDQFLDWARQAVRTGPSYEQLVLPGNLRINRNTTDAEAEQIIQSCPWHRFQMPAYHATAPNGDGISLVNIGVGPSNAKTITDHLAVLRPNCWLMVGHCGGLRQTQTIGDYVLAHAYLRRDGILDAMVPPEVPIPALAEVQIALQDAAANITGDRGDDLKSRLRTGTIVTYDDRNWELRFSAERLRINQSRAIAVDMESGTIATQGFRLRVPYGTLLCVSDKPLHGEIKLPGMANAFYESAVGQHLEIGIEALRLLKERLESLHSRKLRSFDEPPFR